MFRPIGKPSPSAGAQLDRAGYLRFAVGVRSAPSFSPIREPALELGWLISVTRPGEVTF